MMVNNSLRSFLDNTCKQFTRRNGVNYPFDDLVSSSVVAADYAMCCLVCQTTSGCVVFSYNAGTKRCYPKSSIGNGPVSAASTDSGVKIKLTSVVSEHSYL